MALNFMVWGSVFGLFDEGETQAESECGVSVKVFKREAI